MNQSMKRAAIGVVLVTGSVLGGFSQGTAYFNNNKRRRGGTTVTLPAGR
jgi:hypothetical protein